MITLQLLGECCFGCLKEFCFGSAAPADDPKMIQHGTPRPVLPQFPRTEAMPPDENTYLLSSLPSADGTVPDSDNWKLYDSIVKIDPNLMQMDGQRRKEIESKI